MVLHGIVGGHLFDLIDLVIIKSKLSRFQDAFLSNAVSCIGRKEMIGHLIELFNSLNVGSNNCLFFFEDSNIAVHFGVAKLFILEVSERSWHLIFSFMIEQDIESTSIIVDFELSPHGLLNTAK